ncbi:hypothetical protein R5R35_005833 [Gryllus longicercus]|uniref:MADF domain-containing protein n=1 Tax=Gryllus longicercus TaxID=2509291 RepID=A0AAN9VL78_9ORTH
MALVRDEDIDSELVINEVEKRPALFNKTLKDYSDANLKSKLWEEVCLNVLSTIWGQLSTEKKKQAGTLVQRRWKNLRTCFARELREQKSVKSGQPAGKRRKYKFYDQLLFLLPTVEVRETSGNAEPVLSDEEHEETESAQRPPLVRSPNTSSNLNKKKKRSYEESLLDILREKKETASHMDDSETHFALSLVPMLKALPTHRKIDAQIEILQVLRNFQDRCPPTDTLHSFSDDVRYSSFSTPVRLFTGTFTSANQPTTGNSSYTALTSPQDCDSVQSYLSNFSVDSDGSQTMYDVTVHNNV